MSAEKERVKELLAEMIMEGLVEYTSNENYRLTKTGVHFGISKMTEVCTELMSYNEFKTTDKNIIMESLSIGIQATYGSMLMFLVSIRAFPDWKEELKAGFLEGIEEKNSAIENELLLNTRDLDSSRDRENKDDWYSDDEASSDFEEEKYPDQELVNSEIVKFMNFSDPYKNKKPTYH